MLLERSEVKDDNPKRLGESHILGKTPKAPGKSRASSKQVVGSRSEITFSTNDRRPNQGPDTARMPGKETACPGDTAASQEGARQAEGDSVLNDLSTVTVVLVATTSSHSLWTPGLFTGPYPGWWRSRLISLTKRSALATKKRWER